VSGHGRNSRIRISSFLKTSTSVRRAHPNAYPYHAGWEAKVAFLFPFDAYPVRCSSIVSVLRAARQISPDPAYQIHNHTSLLLVHMVVPRGMENVAGTERYLDRLLSAPAQLVNWRLGGWSLTLINPAQVVSKRCVRAPFQSILINPGCIVPVIHATSPSTTIRNAMTQHSKILTTALICYTTSAVAFTFFHVISSQQTPNGGLRFFVKSKFVLSSFKVVNVLTS
jgi:hypothetical protein